MFKLASLFVEVGAEDSALDRTFAGIRGKLAGLAATRFSVPGGGFLAALGLGAAGVGIGKAISGASDLAETLSKVGAVFGAQSDQVTGAADEMARAFGIPRREFLDAASQFGLIATGMGQTQAEAAAMSAKFARLAVDASSFYNVPIADALEKIRAGLTGESEPLKAFGVIMDETTMKAYAVASGLARKGQELNNAQKLAARAALIEKGLATATGDMARTQDGAANQVRKFWGALTNLGDTLGGSLLPSFTKFIGLLNEVATDMGNAATAGQSAWSGFFDFFGGAIEIAGTVYRNWGDIVERTGVMIGGRLRNVVEIADWVGASLEATAKNFAVAWFNAGLSVLKNLENLQATIASGFTKPFAITFDPVLKGFHFEAGPLKLSGVADQLAEIDKRMQDRADARDPGGKAKGAAGAAGPGGPAAAGTSATKGGVTDVDAYARELTEGALGKMDLAKEQVLATREQTPILQAIQKAVEQFDPKSGPVGSWA